MLQRLVSLGSLMAGAALFVGGALGVWAQTTGVPGGTGGLASGEPWSQLLGGGGMGMAGLMFYFYRQDRKSAEESMIKMGSEFRQIVEGNTRVITELVTLISKSDGE
jgi:tetrahydromethanopterin S-methyltransferase subunit D